MIGSVCFSTKVMFSSKAVLEYKLFRIVSNIVSPLTCANVKDKKQKDI